MKLEELLGEELYAKVKAKLDEVNGNEPDKLKHVRYADLSEGEYVAKAKFDSEVEKLNNLMAGKDAEIITANDLIAELKKGTKGDEDLQGKIADYETQVTQLQEQLHETKLKNAVKMALLSERAVDVDYLSFKLNEKLKEKGEILELDENENIKGWNDKLSGLKTQFPAMFESASNGAGKKIINPYRLPAGDNSVTVTKEQFLKMGVEERSKFKSENEALYKQYTGKE